MAEFKCEACGIDFDTKEEMEKHAKEHHGKE